MIRETNSKKLEQVSRFPVRYYLVAGTYEIAVDENGTEANILEANRRMVEALESAGYETRYDERPEGHSWGLWQGTLGQALAFLYN